MELKMKGFSRAKLTLNPKITREGSNRNFSWFRARKLTVFLRVWGLKISEERGERDGRIRVAFGLPTLIKN